MNHLKAAAPLTFSKLDRLTEEELLDSMHSFSRLFVMYGEQGRDAIAGVWDSMLEALDLEWVRREEGALPRRITVRFSTLPRLAPDDLVLLAHATATLRDESAAAARTGKSDLYGTVALALERQLWSRVPVASTLHRRTSHTTNGDRRAA